MKMGHGVIPKSMYIYDENGDIFEMNTYKYQDGGWVKES